MTNNLENTFWGKQILITGAAGYLASILVEKLSNIDCHIIRIGLPGTLFDAVESKARIDDVEGNVSCPGFWETHLENVDFIFHLAAYEHKHGAIFNPVLDFQVNSLSVLYMLEACRIQKHAPFIIYASSSNIVGLPSQLPVDETFIDDPLILFSLHKLTSEKYLRYYAREFNQRCVSLRLTNVYGPVSNPLLCLRVVLNRVIDLALKNGRLLLFQNSSCIRDYIWVEDAVLAFLAAACLGNDCAKGQHYVIGSGKGYSIAGVWRMIADKISHKTGKSILLEETSIEKLDAIEWRNFIADTSLFTEKTGWKANISLDNGLDRTIDFMLSREHPTI
jgi:nucleoside-diphosphate-sugar epimerase